MVMPVVDPKKMAQVRAVTVNLKAEITVDYANNTLTLKVNKPVNATEEVSAASVSLLSQLAKQLAMQLNSFFGIQGVFKEIGK